MVAKSKLPALFAGLALIVGVRWPARPSAAQPPADAATFTEMRWRPIGPFRGGRTKAITGVRTQPNVFYIGAVNGGVWGDDGLRRDVDANLRRPADRLNRRRTAGRADTLLAQWTALKAEAARLNLAR